MSKHHYYPLGNYCFMWCYSDDKWLSDGKPLPWFCIVTHYDEDDGFEIKIGKLMIGWLK
jgi:hypothetical protein